MVDLKTPSLEKIINSERFPIFSPGSAPFNALLFDINTSLADDGCVVLQDFIRPEFLDAMAREVSDVADLAYDKVDDVNVYNTDTNADYRPDHPARIIMKRGNAFVARDLIGDHTIIEELYLNDGFKSFIAQCFGLERVFELDDPYAGLCANVLRPGLEHPWHFDTNEFTVSMLTQAASGGGNFEYCPNIRTPENENMEQVSDVLTNAHSPQVKRLELRPGDLQLFKGRYSLHRVTAVQGDVDRHSAIFAYSEMPGVIGSETRTRQLFGRVHESHLAASNSSVRSDQLMD